MLAGTPTQRSGRFWMDSSLHSPRRWRCERRSSPICWGHFMKALKKKAVSRIIWPATGGCRTARAFIDTTPSSTDSDKRILCYCDSIKGKHDSIREVSHIHTHIFISGDSVSLILSLSLLLPISSFCSGCKAEIPPWIVNMNLFSILLRKCADHSFPSIQADQFAFIDM